MMATAMHTKNIVQDLKLNNTCDLCILRFLNIREAEKLENPHIAVARIFSDEQLDKTKEYEEDDCMLRNSKLKKQNPCSLCLGLLQIQKLPQLKDKVIENVGNCDADEITFSLFLPLSIIIRNFSTYLHLQRKYPSYFTSIIDNGLQWEQGTVPVREMWKLAIAPSLSQLLGKKLCTNNNSGDCIQVNIHFNYEDETKETECLINMHPDTFADRSMQKRKFHNEILTRKSVESVLDNNHTSYELFNQFSQIPPIIPLNFIECGKVVCVHDPLFIAGRYNKYSRLLSQTPWLIKGERKMESSVEEKIIEPVSIKVPNDGVKFMSSGREDVDVRTLGQGRPFVLELTNPRSVKFTQSDMTSLQQTINLSTSEIHVRHLQIVSKDDVRMIKVGETSKTKTYEAFCIVAGLKEQSESFWKEHLNILNNDKSFVIEQRTPIRVLHRRPLAIRPRTVYWMKAEFYSQDESSGFVYFKLRLKVEAGTYIKELVHGDFGRTVPNCAELLKLPTDILALDVEEVDLDWPPIINDNGQVVTTKKQN